MPDTEPLTPDAVRALIAEAEESLALVGDGDWTPQDNLLRRATAALTATLPREDADFSTASMSGEDFRSLLARLEHDDPEAARGIRQAFIAGSRHEAERWASDPSGHDYADHEHDRGHDA